MRVSSLLIAFLAGVGGACSPKPPSPLTPVARESALRPAAESNLPNAVRPAGAAETSSAAYKNVGIPLPETDVCDKNQDGSIKDEIPEGRYSGLLRNARCDQQKFLTMASVMKELGVSDCTFCHAADPANPKKALYSMATPRKDAANWMLATFVDGLQRVDGTAMKCRGCHTSQKGKGEGMAHFLMEPRNVAFTQEWMNEIMTAQFTDRSGQRLRCKSCHEGMAPSREGWNPHVIRELIVTGEGHLARSHPGR